MIFGRECYPRPVGLSAFSGYGGLGPPPPLSPKPLGWFSKFKWRSIASQENYHLTQGAHFEKQFTWSFPWNWRSNQFLRISRWNSHEYPRNSTWNSGIGKAGPKRYFQDGDAQWRREYECVSMILTGFEENVSHEGHWNCCGRYFVNSVFFFFSKYTEVKNY